MKRPMMGPQIFAGTIDALEPIRSYVAQAAASADLLDKSAVYKLCLAVDEIATNIVTHGYEEAGLHGDLKIFGSIENGSLVITLEDRGQPYDPTLHSKDWEEVLNLPPGDRPIGGLGIYLALDGVDDLQYQTADGINRHRFVVRLSEQPASTTPPCNSAKDRNL